MLSSNNIENHMFNFINSKKESGQFEFGQDLKIEYSYFDYRPMLHQRKIDVFLRHHLAKDTPQAE
jgi:hypothetical protein